MNFTIEACNLHFENALFFNTILIGMFLCLGILGNGQVLYLYKFKMPQTEERFFIPHLAVADLLSSVCLALLGITINFHYVNFPYEILCQLLHYFSWVTTSWSAFILLMISISRYLKICRPTGKQMTIFLKKCAVYGCLAFAIINTLPVIYFAGYRSQNAICLESNVTVVMCELREFSGSTHILKMVYIFFEICVIFSNAGLTAALYVPIGLQIYRRFQKRTKQKRKPPKLPESSGNRDSTSASARETVETSFSTDIDYDRKGMRKEETQSTDLCYTQKDLGKDCDKVPAWEPDAVYKGDGVENAFEIKSTSVNINKKRDSCTNIALKSISTRQRKTVNVRNNFTYMFITIIIFYMLSYLPTFVTILLATKDPFHYWYSMDTVTLNFIMLLRRSSIINHIVNPIIYGYFDVVFRNAFINFFCTCKCK
ncbi:uncharacterized protein LOC133178753 [Saccostrea echinata]|uniref:uncharacterized protein LOC133178753 n=1 Tax=Saccostrea echinata TaxID=191078 RepID=UPI002A82E408|nr:uncharacterized protein LOC133178753 [Saccostrea echinata]